MSTPPPESTTVEASESHASPLVALLLHYVNQFLSLCAQFLGLKPSHSPPEQGSAQPDQHPQPPEFLIELLEWLSFDDFQLKLLKGFSIVLFCNFLFISLAWNYYGQRISEKLMRPATSKSILELKKSVSQLKLPTEHTPRI